MIDAEAGVAQESRAKFMRELDKALEGRKKAMRYLMDEKDWDFFMCHLMETDRIDHFFWRDYLNNDADFHDDFISYYEEIDEIIGEVYDNLPKKCKLVLLSDHGFCNIEKEVNINKYLYDNDLLDFNTIPPENNLQDISSKTKAYSLIPGRIFVNLRGREKNGQIEKDGEYESVIQEVTKLLKEMKDPDTGKKIIDSIYRREDLYHGPYTNEAADLIAHPKDGYELKGKLWPENLFGKSIRSGMHTYDDAFVFVQGEELSESNSMSVMDVYATILDLLDVNAPEDIDATSFIV